MTVYPLSHRLYVSAACDYITHLDLFDICKKSDRNNRSDQISGLLLYKDMSFVEYIEGPPELVESCMNKISSDLRHTGIINLSDGHNSERVFDRWEMGVKNMSEEHESMFDLNWETLNTRITNQHPPLIRTMMRTVYSSSR